MKENKGQNEKLKKRTGKVVLLGILCCKMKSREIKSSWGEEDEFYYSWGFSFSVDEDQPLE